MNIFGNFGLLFICLKKGQNVPNVPNDPGHQLLRMLRENHLRKKKKLLLAANSQFPIIFFVIGSIDDYEI